MHLFPFSSAENRLLNLTADDLKKMGVTDTTTKYNSRTAQNNAIVQTGGKMGGSDANAANNQQAYANAQKQLGDAQNTYANQNAGLNSGIKQSVQYNADGTSQLSQGPVQAVGNGKIEQSAINRLREAGQSEDQIRQNLSSPDRQQSIQQTMSNTGLGGTARQTATQTTAQKIADATNAIDNRYNKLRQEGGIVDSANIEREKQTAIQSIIGQAQIQQTEEAQQKQAGDQQAASGAAANQATNDSKTSATHPNTTQWLDAAIQGLPPDYQIIGQSLKATLDAQATQKAAANANLGIETAAADSSNKAYGELLSTMKADSDLFYKEAKGMAEDNQARREASLAAEKKATFERLAWEENKGTRDMKKALDKQVNTSVAGQAIGGGFGSSNWTKMVAEAEYEGETAILDFQKEMGFKRVDVDIAYTQTLDNIYATAGQQKFDALKAHRSEIQQINQFKFSATEKTEERKANAKKEYNNTLAGIAKEQAASIKEATNTVVTTLNQVRDDNRAQEQLGWSVLDKAIDDYGSNLPKSLLDRISKMLPGVDIADVAATKTLEQMKKASGTGGSALIGFGAGEFQSNGSPQGFEDFIAAKEKELGMSIANREQYRAEYNAKAAIANRTSISKMSVELREKAKGLTKWQYGEAVDTFNQLVAANDPEGARYYLDGLGKQIPGASSDAYKSAASIRENIDRLETLYRKVSPKMGPIRGRSWSTVSKYAASDADFWELNSVRESLLGTMARGVLQEKGVLTDVDIARARSTLGMESMDIESALKVLKQTRQTLQISVQNSLAVDRANGYSVRDVQSYIEDKMGQGANDPPPLDDTTESALRNIPYLNF